MDVLWQELFAGMTDAGQMIRVAVRLLSACVLGGLIGFERARSGKAAGIRTHMLVALGSALFVLVPLEAGASMGDATRVIQGLTAGIGFLGAGTILKLTDKLEIQGLDTAASIWLTAAVGMATGAGRLWPALLTILFAFMILALLRRIEHRMEEQAPREPAGRARK